MHVGYGGRGLSAFMIMYNIYYETYCTCNDMNDVDTYLYMLQRLLPIQLGAAGRISGVTPAALILLLRYIKQSQHLQTL